MKKINKISWNFRNFEGPVILSARQVSLHGGHSVYQCIIADFPSNQVKVYKFLNWILSLLFFLFGHGFPCRDFTDRREIWHDASPIPNRSFEILGTMPAGRRIVFFYFSGRLMEGYAFC